MIWNRLSRCRDHRYHCLLYTSSNLINEEKATVIIQHIAYNKLNDSFGTEIFTEPTLKGKLGVNAIAANKHLYDYVIFDSPSVEKPFAEQLDISKMCIRDRDNSITFQNGIKLFAGDVKGAVNEQQLRRIQIRETILSHIERERMLYFRGIKVLSLSLIHI